MGNDVSTNPDPRLTPEEYIELERKAEIKSEYIDGEMFAMSGAIREHSSIVNNIITELNNRLNDRPCEVHGPNLRVKVSAAGAYTYPDVLAVCGELHFEDDQLDTLLNPQLIVEVLSESTESYDRGRKFALYRAIDSLQEYVLVSQSEYRVERYSRRDDGSWTFTEVTDFDGSLELTSVACALPLARVYRRVQIRRAPTAS
jgi:Uma2 family endonuclease